MSKPTRPFLDLAWPTHFFHHLVAVAFAGGVMECGEGGW